MRPFKQTLALEEARRLVMEAARPIDRTESIDLARAQGRVLAEDVSAPEDVPPFGRSAMDGYAVRATDTASASREAPTSLTCVGVVFTAQAIPEPLAPSTCLEIATGAPVPPGECGVVMVEETEREGDQVRTFAPVSVGHNVSPRGSDIAAGRIVGSRGTLLIAPKLGALAAIGVTSVKMFERPRVAIFSTGNEIVSPGTRLGPGQIYDINRFTLSAIVEQHGGIPTMLPTVADRIDDLRAAVTRVKEFDVGVVSGGSSVGERDLLIDAVREQGEVLFHGIAVRPGKPTALARVGGAIVMAMPGNPTSCLSNAYIFLVPLLRQMARLPAYQPRHVTLPLGRPIVSAAGRHQFYSVRIADGHVLPAFKGSGAITSLAEADGYIEIPSHIDRIGQGQTVTVTLF